MFLTSKITKVEDRGPQLEIGSVTIFVEVPKRNETSEEIDMIQLTDRAVLKESQRQRKMRDLKIIKNGKEKKLKNVSALATIFREEEIEPVPFFQERIGELRSFLTVHLNFFSSLSDHEFYKPLLEKYKLSPSKIAPRIENDKFRLHFYRKPLGPIREVGDVIFITDVTLDLHDFRVTISKEYEVRNE